MICPTCIETFQQAIDKFKPDGLVRQTPHHRTVQGFSASVKQDCYLCTLLWNTLEVVPDWWPTFKSSWDKYQPSPDDDDWDLVVTSLGLRGLGWKGQPQSKSYDISIACHMPTQSRATYTVTMMTFCRHLSPAQPLPLSLLLAGLWLKNCAGSHERCNSRQEDDGWHPTRLLSIGQNERLETTMRLINTTHEKPTEPYGTVTHRWGFTVEDKERVILTQATYPMLAKGILLSSMPRLFQDIITFAYQLGLRYMWIDAFCIFQDNNNNDWQRESSLMQKVYTNSYCNISAADAISWSESLVNPRNTGLIASPVIELKRSREDGTPVPAPQQYLVFDPTFWKREVTEALVNTRGWVLQERVLSPRILHFGKRQLMWECCEHSAAETFPDGLHPRIIEAGRTMYKDNDLFFDTKFSYAEQKGDELNLYHLWARLVESYTACELTFQSDKLVACSGLAKIIQARIDDEYVAGMWRKYLEHELLWQPCLPHPSQPRSALLPTDKKKSHLPSWTWASIDRPCTRDPVRYYDNLLFKVEHVGLTYATDDPTGDILPGARLHLRGILMPTKLLQTTHEQPETYWRIVIEGIQLEGVTRYVERFIRAREPFKDGFPVSLNRYQETFEEENENQRIFAMPAWKNTYGIGTQRSLMAILLFRLLDAEKGVYERLGIFKQYDKNCDLVLAMRADVNGEKKEERERVPCVEFREGMHSFVVV
ncbi:unnamed protein product [Sordaria macrospora k-hell]|uniref:WGS project CABT00000000 data, contig 2.10 n=1 Tax=Sordaria macrospora (strain ATCC MYA-333 / DSM 997 / K(L3346) / K-hell) TaxID=771870 RepID=F7VWA6_SORMK|nr:uncharacterized protein SMAC_03484 [Sordaria macrospora k-hell]CCC09928.1 unnamed protein product [Sordaria macrospora k-hell]